MKSRVLKTITIILASNLLVYFICRPKETIIQNKKKILKEEIEIKLKAQLNTTFEQGKTVLIISENKSEKIVGQLSDKISDEEYNLIIKQIDGHKLLNSQSWTIYPYFFVKNKPIQRKASYEVHY